MKLSHELAKIFEKEMDELIQTEIDNSGFMPQEIFENCEIRAAAGIAIAIEKVKKIFALSICSHREMEHAENRDEEIDILKTTLTSEEVEIGTRGFWGN